MPNTKTSQVEYHIDPRQELGHRVLVANISDHELDVGAKHSFEVLVFAVYQIIDRGDANALNCQLLDQF